MKALSRLLPTLWVLVPVVCAQQNPKTPIQGLITEADYIKAVGRSFMANKYYHDSYDVIYADYDMKNEIYYYKRDFEISDKSWEKIMGGPKITDINPDFADKILKNLCESLISDLNKLTHWNWNDTGLFTDWYDLLRKKPIILYAHNKGKGDIEEHVATSSCINNCTMQLLVVHFDTMANSTGRGCFANSGFDSSRSCLLTTLAHEMGHQYIFANYPDLHMHSTAPLVKSLAVMMQEAFAIYTEYCYLQHLATIGKTSSFTLLDLIEDTSKSFQDESNSKYGLSPTYLFYFLCGLDWDATPDATNCPPFNYARLNTIAKFCKNMKNSNFNPKTLEFKDFIYLSPYFSPIKLSDEYFTDISKIYLQFTPICLFINGISSTTAYVTTKVITQYNEYNHTEKLEDFKISLTSEFIPKIIELFPENKDDSISESDYVAQFKEEYKKVSPDIRKRTFQVMLEYLSANQYMK